MLDLDGSGIRLTAESGAAPMFDMFGTGFAVHTGWVQPSTGILVIENPDGTIQNVRNLVGSNGNSGFAALAQFDSNGDGVIDATDIGSADFNGDGVIDASDSPFARLRVWQDQNGDGVVDPGEMMTLGQAGIASIAVASIADTSGEWLVWFGRAICGCARAAAAGGPNVGLRLDQLRNCAVVRRPWTELSTARRRRPGANSRADSTFSRIHDFR